MHGRALGTALPVVVVGILPAVGTSGATGKTAVRRLAAGTRAGTHRVAGMPTESQPVAGRLRPRPVRSVWRAGLRRAGASRVSPPVFGSAVGLCTERTPLGTPAPTRLLLRRRSRGHTAVQSNNNTIILHVLCTAKIYDKQCSNK